MNKVIALVLFSLPLSLSAKAATIDPAATVTKFEAGGSIRVQTVDINPYRSEGSVILEPFTGAGQTIRRTSSSSSIAMIDISRAPSVASMSEGSVHTQGPTIGEGMASFSYYFKIVGPATTSIPILVQAEGQTKVSGPLARATATFNLIGLRAYVINEHIETRARDISNGVDFTPPLLDSFKVDQYFALLSNNEYLVQMNAYSVAANGNQLPGPSLASAFVDPLFSIDPRFSDYSLVFSGGIINSAVSAVPLPASLPLFGAALLALGAARYGQRRMRSASLA